MVQETDKPMEDFQRALREFITRVNEFNKRTAEWMSISDSNPFRERMADSIKEILRTSHEINEQLPLFSNEDELLKAVYSLKNQLVSAKLKTNSVIQFYPDRNMTNPSGIPDDYLIELDSMIEACENFLPKVGGTSSSQAASSVSGRNEKQETNTNQQEEPEPSDEEKVAVLRGFVTAFTRDINFLIEKHKDWYLQVRDVEDRELGATIEKALQNAEQILAMEDARIIALQNHTDDDTNFLETFVDSLPKIVSVCDNLLKHYKDTLTPDEFEADSAPLTEFREVSKKYADAVDKPGQKSVPQEVLDLIEHGAISGVTISNSDTITLIKSDVPDAETEDSLNIMPDVNALASVITYAKVRPPLAIGLFGNWGSGKSFFMKKLRRQIDVFARDEGEEFVSRVVHIEFNSWHYSDSNLWASFVTKIFEDLDSYGKKHPKEVEELFKKLNAASEFLTQANTQLEGIKATIKKLEEQLSTTKNDIEAKAKKLSGIKLIDITQEVLEDDQVKDELEKLRRQLPQKELKSLADVQRSVKELEGFGNKFSETLKLLLTFKTWQSWVALALFILILTSSLWFYPVFGVYISEVFSLFGKYANLAAVVLTPLAGIASYASVGLNRVQEKLKSVAAICSNLEKKAITRRQSEIDKIQSELDVQKEAHIQKEAEINKLRKEQAEVQAMIDDIQSGKKLANFIAGRVGEQRYVNSLGLISWIRKDFQRLDELIKEQQLANKLKQLSKEEQEKIFQIDRIVLYIDDLDRCSEEVVVKVLEAIHLILAFELFVVVVGVDPRWMHNALENRYSKQLRKHNRGQESATGNDEMADIDSATSYDYLEKIFQIPLSLNEITSTGKARLIDDALAAASIITTTTTKNTTTMTPKDTEKKKQDPGETKEDSKKEETENKTEEQKAEDRKVVRKAKQQLVITREEIQFMKEISPLIGQSPRAVNRYINLYRILRSHRDLNISASPLNDYCAVMVLLGIITGIPDESEEFFRALSKEKNGTFGNFVATQGERFRIVADACKVRYKLAADPAATVGKISISSIKKKFELVQRFSFRAYNENESPGPGVTETTKKPDIGIRKEQKNSSSKEQ